MSGLSSTRVVYNDEKPTKTGKHIRYNFTVSRVLFKTINRVAYRNRTVNNLSLWFTLGLEVDNI